MPKKTEMDSDSIDFNKIGKAKIAGGKIVWTPPPKIDPALEKEIQKSVDSANKMIVEGKLTVDSGGKIKLTGKE